MVLAILSSTDFGMLMRIRLGIAKKEPKNGFLFPSSNRIGSYYRGIYVLGVKIVVFMHFSHRKRGLRILNCSDGMLKILWWFYRHLHRSKVNTPITITPIRLRKWKFISGFFGMPNWMHISILKSVDDRVGTGYFTGEQTNSNSYSK